MNRYLSWSKYVVPYCCGIGGLTAATTCMATPALVNIPFLISEANTLANSGLIDSTTGVSGDRVYVFHGSEDSVVLPGITQNMKTSLKTSITTIGKR